MQHDFVDPGGAVPCQGASEIVPRIKKLMTEARAAGIPIIYTKEVHRPQKVDFGRELDGKAPLHTVEGTVGAEILEELTPLEGDCVVYKRRLSAFFNTDLELLLKAFEVSTVYLTGAATDVCVHYTAIDAHQRDLRVKIVRDCVAGTSKKAHEAALANMEQRQRGCVIQYTLAAEDFRLLRKFKEGPQVS